MDSFHWLKYLLDPAFILLLFLSGTEADRDLSGVHRFVTRPELRAPKWNVTIYDQEHVSPGYWFVAPYEQIGQTEPGDGWIGPHIYDDHGELVWSGASMFNNMSVMDFRISQYLGNEVISLIRPEENSGVLLDDHFEVVQQVPIEGFNMHDWNFVDGGTRALAITRGVMNASVEESRATGLEEGLCEANFHGIDEIDTKTWKPTWSWTSWGHISLEETTFKYGPASDRCNHTEWDFFHANAVDKCPDGDFVLSARHTDTIYKISRKDGSVVWRLGGLRDDFATKGFNFARQHDVRCRSQNETHTVISFLDNAKGEDPQTPTNEFSRGLIVALEPAAKTASIVAQYDHPHGPGGYAHRRGAFQLLQSGNVFMCWSEQALQSEHTADGKMVMEAKLNAEWVGTYRSYKFPFVGRPVNPPDVYAQAFNPPSNENATTTEVYVSWNGATEVSSWKLFKTTKYGVDKVQLGWVPTAGFETLFSYDGFAKYVVLEAADVDGKVLGRSNVVETIPPANVLNPVVAEEELWQQRITQGVASVSSQGSEADVDGYIGSFAGGFFLSAVLSSIIFVFWYARHNGIAWSVKLPWHRSREQKYQPILGKEAVRLSISEC